MFIEVEDLFGFGIKALLFFDPTFGESDEFSFPASSVKTKSDDEVPDKGRAFSGSASEIEDNDGVGDNE